MKRVNHDTPKRCDPKLLIVVSLFVFVNAAVSQDSDTVLTTTYPIIGIHLGAGTVGGGRVGIQLKISDRFSFEGSYGTNVLGFVGLVDADDRLGIRINWYPQPTSAFAVGLCFVHRRMLNFHNYSDIIAEDVGLFPFRNSKVSAFARIGFGVGFRNQPYPEPTYFVPNLDVGLAWNFL